MAIKIGTISYTKDGEDFEVDLEITSREFHEEPGGYKEPNDTVETVHFKATTEHGTITGSVTARRTGFNNYFEIEDIDRSIDNEEIELSDPECTIEEDKDEEY